MKKKDIWISLVIIAVSVGVLYFYTQRTGYIRLDSGEAKATLDLRSSLLSKESVCSGRQPEMVRARIHRPRHLRLSIDQGGHNYFILSQGPWGELSKIKVKNNQTAILRLGPPLKIIPKIQKRNSVVEIQYDIVGHAGERYEKFVRKNNRAVARASLKIVDEAGNVLESGKFKFG
jgi:hypothetical protein